MTVCDRRKLNWVSPSDVLLQSPFVEEMHSMRVKSIRTGIDNCTG